MSTRSYVGIIEGDKVRYGYHHSSSYLENLGIDLFENIQTKQGAYSMIGSYVDALSYEKTKEEFFRIPGESIDMEFCYGFDVEEEEWYISSLHFTDASKMYKLTEVVQNDIEMNAYKDMFVADAQDGVIREIRKHIRVESEPDWDYLVFATEEEAEEFAAEKIGKNGSVVATVDGKTAFLCSTSLPIESNLRMPIEGIVNQFLETLGFDDEDDREDISAAVGAAVTDVLIEQLEHFANIKIINASLDY